MTQVAEVSLLVLIQYCASSAE